VLGGAAPASASGIASNALRAWRVQRKGNCEEMVVKSIGCASGNETTRVGREVDISSAASGNLFAPLFYQVGMTEK
jgi:hypothetical protein